MKRTAGRRTSDEGGFTLIELLAVIAILGVISFGLTEAVILGFKTTDAVTTDVTRFVGVQALRSYFTDDVRRADQAFDPGPAGDPCATSSDALLHLSWTEAGGTITDVAYSLEADSPAVAGQAQLVRWSCTTSGPPAKRMLGLLEFDPAGPAPVEALCAYPGATPPGASTACQPLPTDPEPATITMRVLTNRPKDPPVPLELTVRRRTT